MTTQVAPLHRINPSEHMASEIRAELARQRLSIRALSVKMGVSQAWLNRRVSTLQTDLTPEDLELIAGALEVPVYRLLPKNWLPRLDSNQQPAGQPTRGKPSQGYRSEYENQTARHLRVVR